MDFLKDKEENSKSPELTEKDIELTYEKLFQTSEKDRDLPRPTDGSATESSDGKTDHVSSSEPENGISASDSNEEAKASRNHRNWKLCHSANITAMNEGHGFLLSGKLTRHKSEIKLKDKTLDNVLPESLKGMGQDNIIRFLKAKIKVLTEQLEVLHSDEKKHIDKIKGNTLSLLGEIETLAGGRRYLLRFILELINPAFSCLFLAGKLQK